MVQKPLHFNKLAAESFYGNCVTVTGTASRDGCFLKNKKKYGDFCKYRTLMDKGEVTGYQIFLCCIVLKANIEKSRLKLIKLLQKPFVTVKGKFRQTFPAFNAGCAVQW